MSIRQIRGLFFEVIDLTAIDSSVAISIAEQRELGQVEGIVFDIQRYSVHDGPGLRTNVFLKGCPLRCQWCANPESQQMQPELAPSDHNCITCGQLPEPCPGSWGAGPRASQYLILGAKTYAALRGNLAPSVDDVKRVARPVLRHRIITNFNAEAEGIKSDTIIDRLIEAVPPGDKKTRPTRAPSRPHGWNGRRVPSS